MMRQTTYFTMKILIQNKQGKENKSYPLLGLKQLPGLLEVNFLLKYHKEK